MNLLALETSTQHASVAVLTRAGRCLQAQAQPGAAASSQILPLVQSLLREAALTMRDLDAVAFGAGPGAFTGVRVACALAQGLGFGCGIPVVGLCTLEALAEEARLAGVLEVGATVLAAQDARMNECYVARYQLMSDLTWQCVEEPWLAPLSAAPLRLEADYVIGSGAALLYPGAPVATLVAPTARAVAYLAQRRLALGQPHAPAYSAQHAAPLYVRNKVAYTSDERARGLHRTAA